MSYTSLSDILHSLMVDRATICYTRIAATTVAAEKHTERVVCSHVKLEHTR
jgi:hypothetical protein